MTKGEAGDRLPIVIQSGRKGALMKPVQSFLAFLAFAGAAALGLLALGNLATLIVKGPAAQQIVRVEGDMQAAAPAAASNGMQASEAANAKPQAAETDTATSDAIDPDKGAKAFSACKACHTAENGGANKVGPNLWGAVNRAPASVEGFKYSKAMVAFAGGKWEPAVLDDYLANPKKIVPGTAMAYAGMKSAADRHNLIAWLATQSDTPLAADQLGFAIAAADAPAADGAPAAPEAAEVVYADPPPPSDADIAKSNEAVAALKALLPNLDYERARHHPIHLKPAIDAATDAECLVCHEEVLATNTREKSPAGVESAQSIAWYQTLSTYDGPQATFHQRHATTPYARAVMNLKCNFCHQGNDVREESPTMTVTEAAMASNNGAEPFTNRKMVNPSKTCLLCHGAMPDPVNIMGLAGPWHEARVDLESEEAPNGCITCHGELFRTNRHKVSYLNAATIEDLAAESSDVCFGCHGGRSWYRVSYPYPRHPWPGMDPAVPDWAKDRPTESDARYAVK